MTVIFACANSAIPALDAVEGGRPEGLCIHELPCGGAVSVAEILRAVADGAAKVLVLTCHEGVCRSMDGDRHASRKVARALTLLAEVGATVPVELHHVAANEPGRLSGILAGSAGTEGGAAG